MERGSPVRSRTDSFLGIGQILELQEFLGEIYATVLFPTVGQRVLPLSALEVIETPPKKLEAGDLSPAAVFLLRLTVEWANQTEARSTLKTAGNFKILPLPHQLLAVRFVLDQFKPRVLIADEVGLGKTVEAALICEELKARGMVQRVLIVVPSGLCLQWCEELRMKFGEDFVLYNKETIHSLKQLQGETTNVWTLSDKIITSLDFIKPKKIHKDLSLRERTRREWHNQHICEAAVAGRFDLVIFDEAHKLNKEKDDKETARYKIGKALSEAVPMMLLLSATPHQGDSLRFRNLLQLVDPVAFYRNSVLTVDNVRRVTVRNNKRAVVDFQGNRLFKQRLASLYVIERTSGTDQIELDLYTAVSDYVTAGCAAATAQNNFALLFLLLAYQRMVSSSSRAILKSLSRRLQRLESIHAEAVAVTTEGGEIEDADLEQLQDMDGQAQLEQLEKLSPMALYFLETELKLLSHCVKLAQRATYGRNDAKPVRLLALLDEFKSRENDPRLKFIIFTEFRETQSYIQETLERLGYKVVLIHGGISMEDRVQQVALFRDMAQVLISTDAGGEGINLQFCRVMINYDLPWNPMRLEQRIGRIDRIGQKYDVKVINFQLADTVEQRVREVIEGKMEIIRQDFQDGEDKLADILSTLQENFSFENIYVRALSKRQSEAAELEELAQKIVDDARQMLTDQELVIPVSNLADSYTVSEQDVQRSAEICRVLVERYLTAKGQSLVEVERQPCVYTYRDPESGKRMGPIVFEARLAVEDGRLEHVTLQHPLMRTVLSLVEEIQAGAARLQIKDRRFTGDKGYLFVYRLTLSNYLDVQENHLITVYVSLTGESCRSNQRISQYFQNAPSIRAEDIINDKIPMVSEDMQKVAEREAQQKAESLFFESRERQRTVLSKEEGRILQYFADRKRAVERIALENVRVAKEREMLADLTAKRQEWERKRHLAPKLELLQVAYVEFTHE